MGANRDHWEIPLNNLSLLQGFQMMHARSTSGTFIAHRSLVLNCGEKVERT